MSGPKYVLLPPEEANLPEELSDFNQKRKIDPPIRSSYLAVGIAYLQSLFRLKDQDFCQSALAGLSEYISMTDEIAPQWPVHQKRWEVFKNLVLTLLQSQKDKLFRWWQKYIGTNAMEACDAIDSGMRLLMCQIIDKDYKYKYILNNPLNAREDFYFFEHFCNKLRVNILLATQTSTSYINRSDKNKSPLVTLYMENDITLSVLYHREYILFEAGTLADSNLDRFPFIYDPRSDSRIVQRPNFQAEQRPAPQFASPNTDSPGINPIRQVPQFAPPNTDSPGINPIRQVPQFPPPNTDSSGINPIRQVPMREESKQDPQAEAIIDTCKRLISSMSSIVLLSNNQNFDDDFIKNLDEFIEMVPSANNGDVARLWESIKRLRPQVSQAPNCDHIPLKYVAACGNEHCAYCLKEIMNRDKLKAVCEHGNKISHKNVKEINALLEVSPDPISIQNSAKTAKFPDRPQYQMTDMPDLGPSCPIPDASNVQGIAKTTPTLGPNKASPMQMPNKVSPMQGPPKASPMPEPPKANPLQEPKKKLDFKMPTAKPPPQMPNQGDFPASEESQVPFMTGPMNPGQSQFMGPFNTGNINEQSESLNLPSQFQQMPPRPNSINIPSQFQPQLNAQVNRPSYSPLPTQPAQPQSNLPARNEGFPPGPPLPMFPQGSQPNPQHNLPPKNVGFPPGPPAFPQAPQPNPQLAQSHLPPKTVGFPPGAPLPMFPQNQQPNPQPWNERNQPGPVLQPAPIFQQESPNLQPWNEGNQPRPQMQPQAVVRSAPQNGKECACCKEVKSPDDFSFACSGHSVCNACRVKNLNQCVSCERFYSDSQKQELEIILISFQ